MSLMKLQLTRAFFFSMLSAIGFGMVAWLIGEHKIVQFDNAIIYWVQGHEFPQWTATMKLFTTIGSTPVVAILTVIILFLLYKVLHHLYELFLFISVVLGSSILNQILKFCFERARPTTHRLVSATGYSFPSGHSMEAFALYGILVFLLWRHTANPVGRILLILGSVIMTLLIGISRIYLGVHYPSDVIGGYLAGGFWLSGAIWVYQHYEKNRQQKLSKYY